MQAAGPALLRLTQTWLALGQDVARFVVRTEAALLRWLVAYDNPSNNFLEK
ncbi:MAG TPA: hypothetical protein VFO93_11560 [Hymenobacter sp.]|uniref:hypothetical protein n=1 Tax=Hymenobacter sp. TaxID=1898978 RepID=UPI002D7E3B9C|nr:hypothetical protein [Hymenobacter sp.]HET9504170.1 hypothetical protein [Hymenobacter sp.]